MLTNLCFSAFLFCVLPASYLLIEADGFSFGPRHGLRARLYETFVIFMLLAVLTLFFFSLIVSIIFVVLDYYFFSSGHII